MFLKEGWARERWGAKFFLETIPMLARDNMMSINGKIWLPNNQCVQDNVKTAKPIISVYYDIIQVGLEALNSNPLFFATGQVDDVLADLPDGRTNETQLKPYLAYSDYPFVVLQIKAEHATVGIPGYCCISDNRKLTVVIDEE